MKKKTTKLTRREFVGGAVAAAGVIAGAPAFLRGQNLNNKLNIAFIACGGRALTSISELTINPSRGRHRRPPAAARPRPRRRTLTRTSPFSAM